MVRGRSVHHRERRVPVTGQMPLLSLLLPAQHCIRLDGCTCRSGLRCLRSLP